MYKFIQNSVLLGLLLSGSLLRAGGPVNPITIALADGPISLVQGGTGTASYVVSLNSAVGAPLTMNITNLPSWATVAFSNCSPRLNINSCSAPSITLSPGQQCCFMFNVDGTSLSAGANYTLTPSVISSLGGAFGSIATAQTVSVLALNNTYTVDVVAGTNGSVSLAGNQTVTAFGNTSLLTATPNAGYIVDYWGLAGNSAYQGGGLTSIYYQVQADNTITVYFVLYTAQNTVPAPPTQVTALNTAIRGSVALTWAAPTNTGGTAITGYQVTPYIGANPQTPISIGNLTTTTITGLTPNTTYTFTVQAINVTGNSAVAYSSPVTIPSTSIAISPSTLALSINAPTVNSALTGVARTVTFYNVSGSGVSLQGTPVNVQGVPALSSFTTNCSNNITSGGNCTVTITPGSTATSTCTNGTVPQAGMVTLNTTGGAYTAYVYVLGYGCLYQGGYIYSIDDTTPTTSSVGGSVVTTSDQSPAQGTQWSNQYDSGNGIDPGFRSIWGIAEQSLTTLPYPNNVAPTWPGNGLATLVAGQVACNGNIDGSCNTNNISLVQHSPNVTSLCRQPLSNTGAVCTAGTTNCYNGWYVPSICELGYFPVPITSNLNSGCGSPGAPTIQNIQSQLVDLNLIGNQGNYWSSTESSIDPHGEAWYQSPGGQGAGINQAASGKEQSFAVRCSRALTL